MARRVAELEPYTGHLRTLDHPAYDLAGIRAQEGAVVAASAAMRALLERAERDGDYSSLPFLLSNAALADFLDGQPDLARQHLDRAERLAAATDQAVARVHTLVVRARLESRLGDADAALAAAAEAFAIMAATGWRIAEWWMRADLALLELSRDDPAAALAFVADAADPDRADEAGRHLVARAAAVDALVRPGPAR